MMMSFSADCLYHQRRLLLSLLLLLSATSSASKQLGDFASPLWSVPPTPKHTLLRSIAAISSHDLGLFALPPHTALINVASEVTGVPRGGGLDDHLSSWPTFTQETSGSSWPWLDQIARKYLSSDTVDAIQEIVTIIQNSEFLKEFGLENIFTKYSPLDILWSVIAFYQLQQILETSNPMTIDLRSVVTDKQLLDELEYYFRFATAAYGWRGALFYGRMYLDDYCQLAELTGLKRSDIVLAKWSSETKQPAYYIARDAEHNSIVLAVRGTLTLKDVLTDFCASTINFDERGKGQGGKYRAHSGMVDAAAHIASKAGDIVKNELNANPEYKLVIVGHSLGGGVAAIITAMWQRRFRDRIRSIGYGNPCIFPLDLTKAFDNLVSVEARGDRVATLSLGHLADTTKAVSKLCRDRGMRNEILKRLGNSHTVSRDDIAWCSNTMMILRKQMNSEKLYPPGTIYQASGSGSGVVLSCTDASVFGELKLIINMVELVRRHWAPHYAMLLRASVGK